LDGIKIFHSGLQSTVGGLLSRHGHNNIDQGIDGAALADGIWGKSGGVDGIAAHNP
jgi:hypothetical protein